MPKKRTLATLGETIDPGGAFEYQIPQFLPQPGSRLDLALESPEYQSNIPRASGGITLPMLGNELQLQGEYQSDPYLPDWRLMLGLQRRF